VGAHNRVDSRGAEMLSKDEIVSVKLNMVIHLEKLASAYRDLLK
jgi:hypothetical protein